MENAVSLWYKQIDRITLEDVEAFCRQRHREGLRLDYKREIPRDLNNLVAAFANTSGGLILLGVAADATTNEPVWPPHGMPADPGIEERITSICQDSIYPPLRPQISPILANPHAADTVLAVVRVDESPESPHGVDQGTRIYIRTGSQNRPCHLAHIDRIQHLLNRRQNIEEQREAFIVQAITRARRKLPDPLPWPVRWASVCPFFPWKDLCSPQQCWAFRDNPNPHVGQMWSRAAIWQPQRVSGGWFAVAQEVSQGRTQAVAVASVSARGHVFALAYAPETEREAALEQHRYNRPATEYLIGYAETRQFAMTLFELASAFYRRNDVEKPGMVLLTLGLSRVLNLRMYGPPNCGDGHSFPDEEYRADHSIHLSELLENPQEAARPLFDQLAFAFDLPPIP
jgi:hypothetical protein